MAAPSVTGAVTSYVRQQLEQGLDAAQTAPVGSGYAQVLAGYAGTEGLFARGEVGWHPLQDVTLYGYGEAASRLGVTAGAGARLIW